jgi:chemotaxis protein methyltransferase CheR
MTDGMEFPFSDADFLRLSTLITARTGIELPPHKKALVYGRLARRLRALGLKDFTSYVNAIEHDLKNKNNDEMLAAIQAVTTNVTAFFREAHHFDLLPQHLDRLLAAHGELHIWSAACSSGEEAWSLAMVVAEWRKTHPNAPVSLLATDIDTTVLAKAKAGVYTLPPAEVAAHPLLKRYLVDDGPARLPHERRYKVAQHLLPQVTFRQLNLIENWRLPQRQQVVLCRNVIIYFGRDTKVKLFANIADHMAPQGLLCIGHSESLLGVSDAFTPLGRTAYLRA